ncbi:hypothetical protein ACO0QE_000474 [Hanseniaspora vineae]
MPIYSSHNVLPKYKKDGDKYFPELLEPNNQGGYVHFLFEPDALKQEGNVSVVNDINCTSCGSAISPYCLRTETSWKCLFCQEANYFQQASTMDADIISREYIAEINLNDSTRTHSIQGYRLLLVFDACVKDEFELKQYNNYLTTLTSKLSTCSLDCLEIACFWIFPDSNFYQLTHNGTIAKCKNKKVFTNEQAWVTVQQFQQLTTSFSEFVKIQKVKTGKRLKRNIPFEMFESLASQDPSAKYIYKANILLFGGCTTKDGKVVDSELKNTIRDFQKYNVSAFRKASDFYSSALSSKKNGNAALCKPITYHFFICSLHDCGIWEMFTGAKDKCDLVMFLDDFEGSFFHHLFQRWWENFFITYTNLKILSSNGKVFKNCGVANIGLERVANKFTDSTMMSDVAIGFKGTQFKLNNSSVKNYCATFHLEGIKNLESKDHQHRLAQSIVSAAQFPAAIVVQFEIEYYIGLSQYKKVSCIQMPVVDNCERHLAIDTKVLSVVLGKQSLHHLWRFAGTNLSNIEWKIKETHQKINSLLQLRFLRVSNKSHIMLDHEQLLQLLYMMKFSTKLLDITNVSPDEYIKESLIKWGGKTSYADLIKELKPKIWTQTSPLDMENLQEGAFDLNHPLITSVTIQGNMLLEVADSYILRGSSEFLNAFSTHCSTLDKPTIDVVEGQSKDRLVVHKIYPSIFLAKQNVLFDYALFKQRLGF